MAAFASVRVTLRHSRKLDAGTFGKTSFRCLCTARSRSDTIVEEFLRNLYHPTTSWKCKTQHILFEIFADTVLWPLITHLFCCAGTFYCYYLFDCLFFCGNNPIYSAQFSQLIIKTDRWNNLTVQKYCPTLAITNHTFTKST